MPRTTNDAARQDAPRHAASRHPAGSSPPAPTDAAIGLPGDLPIDRAALERHHAGDSEWLLTNGLGGFAMGTAWGTPQRRYHALLVAATKPPLGRVVALHSTLDSLALPTGTIDAFTYDHLDGTRTGQGRDILRSFVASDSLRWTFVAQGVTLERELVMLPGTNAIILRYRVQHAPAGSTLRIRPLLGMRDFHQLRDPGGTHQPATRWADGRLTCTSPILGFSAQESIDLTLRAPGATWLPEPITWKSIAYRRDQERGQGFVESLPSPGVLVIPLREGETTFELAAWVGDGEPEGFEAALARVRARREGLVSATFRAARAKGSSDLDAPALAALAVAADRFVVRRDGGEGALASVIAGYPWFSDWGRDTFISMPGLLLATGRHEEARGALRAFARLARDGLVPNCFDDGSGRAWYNTVDASLWFIHAATALLRDANDAEGFQGEVRHACGQIIRAYRDGTDYGIAMDPADALIRAGDATTQLTWMDAKRDGVVFTPRHGKPVEINALWYSALLELADALDALPSSATPDPVPAVELRALATRVRAAFEPTFWNDRAGCLFDVLTPDGPGGSWRPIPEVRPNQLFAVCLPHSPLSPERARAVVDVCTRSLLTPVGLRTLAPGEPKYRPRFEGDLMSRDGAYHNGTVWPWLLGPYASAVLRVGGFSPESRQAARSAIEPMLHELLGPPTSRASIRTLAEVYDADEPRRADGCMAQAWTIAELLRVLLLVRS